MSSGILPKGENLRRAVRWLGEQDRHDVTAIEQASRRFDLSPMEEDFLLTYFTDRATTSARKH
jgi:hypothetical protein